MQANYRKKLSAGAALAALLMSQAVTTPVIADTIEADAPGVARLVFGTIGRMRVGTKEWQSVSVIWSQLGFWASSLVFVPSTPEQEAHVRPLVAELNAAGVAVRFAADLVEREYEAYSVGETYGYLHVVPAGTAVPEDYGSRDVLVLEAAPPDLTTLAGMISTLPQSSLSHSNLRLRERGLPNVMLTGAYTDTRVTTLEDQLVHVVATEEALTIEAATLEDAQAYWDAHSPMVGPVTSDLTVTALEGMDTLVHADAIAYGAKAANLGELHAILPAANRVTGFGIPFSAYRDFMVHNGLDASVTAQPPQ